MATLEFQQAPLRRYSYRPLLTTSSFRVLELLSGDSDDDIRVRLHHSDWSNPPSYEAISYAWGDTNIKVQITCEDSALEITPNLHDGLRQMRQKDFPRLLWADSICIDQNDIAERGHQVSNMLKIYQNATLVLVWLGLDEDRQAEKASEIIRGITEAACFHLGISISELRKVDDFNKLITKRLQDQLSDIMIARFSSSLDWFYRRPWFRRLWVYQEVNSGTESLVICGSTHLSWEAIAFYATLFPLPGAISPSDWSILKQYSIRTNLGYPIMMRRRYSPGSSELSQVVFLHGHRRFSCSDPRDRIYALLGMPAFTGWCSAIEADYTESKVDLYQRIVELSVMQTSSLDFLSFVQHRKLIDTSFPSWIPCWDRGILRRIIFHYSKTAQNTTFNKTTLISIDGLGHVLKVQGILLDTITDSDTTYLQKRYGNGELPYSEKADLLQYFLTSRNRASEYITGENMMEVISMVLRAGLDDYYKPQRSFEDKIQADFAALLNVLLKNAGLNVDLFQELNPYIDRGDSRNFEIEAESMGLRRTIFRTSKGYMGLGPDTLQQGDITVVLFGGKVPYILRPQDAHYLFVGEAYIHGVMNGEVILQWRDGDLKDEVFEIH